MNIDAIKSLVADDMKLVNQLILQQLESPIKLIQEIGDHIIQSGGKRLRPLIVLLTAKAFGYKGEFHCHLAAIIEFIHTATLLHDDVIDHSTLRRGKKTANAMWGTEASVLVGDFVYSRSIQMAVKLQNIRIMEILSNSTNKITEGEILQLVNRHNVRTTEDQYMEVIHNKTAVLFEAASKISAVLCDRSRMEVQAVGDYGKHLGMAFQLVDDALDFNASAEQIGKNIGDDLAEGKATLPLIYSMQIGTPEQSHFIEQTLQDGNLDNLPAILQTIESTGAIAYTYAAANKQVELALAALQKIPASPFRDALKALAEFATARTY